jgi:hypothetical protein
MTSTLKFTFAVPFVVRHTVPERVGREIHFSHHALERYQERCRPEHKLHELPALLCELEPIALLHLDPPRWAHWRPTIGGAFLTIGAATFALEPDRRQPRRLVATTCLRPKRQALSLVA